MGSPIVLFAVFIVSGFFAWRWIKTERVQRSRNQDRLKVIEGQLAALRAVLRVGQAEYLTRQRMQTELHRRNVFANPTVHEEYRSS